MNTITYEVISYYAIISSKPTILSSILGFVSKGSKIKVVSISNSWAFFYYNDKSAYIRLSSIQLVSPKVTGSVTIKYIDEISLSEISYPTLYTNQVFSSYTYIIISGYSISSDSSQTVTLTNSIPNQTIVFKYIKPLISPNEKVIIDFYITDYYHNEYINEDYSSNFTVTVKVDGKDNIILPDITEGDHSINIGTFTNMVEQKFSIFYTDQYGRNSHELFNFFLVQDVININEYVMSTNDLAYYKIDNTNNPTNVTSTREGLQKLLDDKKSQGYTKLKLLNGIYRVDHLGTIYIPTKFTLDMNNVTLKLNGFTGAKALMMDINNTFDSHVINGTIEGDYFDHDYTNSPNNSEWVNGIDIGGESKYSSYENILIKDITGYGSTNGIANSRDGVLGYTYLYPRDIGNNFKLGDIDKSNGNDITSTNRTTCDLRDISGYSEIGYISVSLYLGYQGNPCGTWNLICHFYDINKNFIKSIDAYQYRRIAVPSNDKFMRVTILNEAHPTNLSIQLFRIPTHCSFKNIKHEDCRCVGMAQAAMKDILVENCEFTKCGQASAKCAYDTEDGWDMMQDATFIGLNFNDNPNNDFLTCTGHNFAIENMVAGKVHFKERTNSYIVRNCSNISNAYLGNNTKIRTGYRPFLNNIIIGNISCDSKTDWIIIMKDRTIYNRAEGNVYSIYLRCKIGPETIPKVADYSYGLASSIYKNCSIKNLNTNIIMLVNSLIVR